MARLTDGDRVGRRPPASWRHCLGAIFLAALLAWGDPALAQPAATVSDLSTPEGEGAGRVACLLPAGIDRFGQQLTIVGARQRIETSRADCEARGGEVIDEPGPAAESTESVR